ncbi:MAG: VOC family protein [Trichloromonadaceae bacterium]
MTEQTNLAGWFEIPVTDMDRAKTFYESVFDLHLELQEMGPQEMAWFPMQEEIYGAGGALVRGPGYLPAQTGVIIYLTTADIETTLAKAQAQGGRVLARKTAIGDYGFIGFIADTEGNRIGIHSRN